MKLHNNWEIMEDFAEKVQDLHIGGFQEIYNEITGFNILNV